MVAIASSNVRAFLFLCRPGLLVERSRLRRLDEEGSHHGQIPQELESAPLLRGRAVVELGPVDLAREVEEDSNFVLE